MSSLPFAHAAVLVVAVTACIWDLRTRRIPNVLTLGAAAAALLFHVLTGGLHGGLASAAGWVVGMATLFVAFALGGMGAGDVKLLGAIGAWIGPMDAVWLALYTGIAGGLLAVGVAAMHGYLRQACRNIWMLLAHWRVAGLRPMAQLTLARGDGPRLAYATAILAGTVATVWLQ
jgi:prepilin peptidase CpaA